MQGVKRMGGGLNL